MVLADFASLLRARRAELGLTKSAVARRYGHDPAAVAFYEDATSRPSLAHVDALADAYELPRNQIRGLVGYAMLPDTEPSLQARLLGLETQLTSIGRDLAAAVAAVQSLRVHAG
jgi:transcriptional regulator with XRE-family HTH domain